MVWIFHISSTYCPPPKKTNFYCTVPVFTKWYGKEAQLNESNLLHMKLLLSSHTQGTEMKKINQMMKWMKMIPEEIETWFRIACNQKQCVVELHADF